MSGNSAPIYLDKSTLVIIPCSAKKNGCQAKAVAKISMLDQLPSDLSKKLADARRAIAHKVQLDERTLTPAWQRYNGTLYCAAAPVLGNAIQRGQLPHLLILSGGYGIVHAREPIGTYNATLVLRHWPNDLLPRAIAAYASRNCLRKAILLASASTSYVRVLRRVAWLRAGVKDALPVTQSAARLGPSPISNPARAVSQSVEKH
jgi:hypothetical protein